MSWYRLVEPLQTKRVKNSASEDGLQWLRALDDEAQREAVVGAAKVDQRSVDAPDIDVERLDPAPAGAIGLLNRVTAVVELEDAVAEIGGLLGVDEAQAVAHVEGGARGGDEADVVVVELRHVEHEGARAAQVGGLGREERVGVALVDGRARGEGAAALVGDVVVRAGGRALRGGLREREAELREDVVAGLGDLERKRGRGLRELRGVHQLEAEHRAAVFVLHPELVDPRGERAGAVSQEARLEVDGVGPGYERGVHGLVHLHRQLERECVAGVGAGRHGDGGHGGVRGEREAQRVGAGLDGGEGEREAGLDDAGLHDVVQLGDERDLVLRGRGPGVAVARGGGHVDVDGLLLVLLAGLVLAPLHRRGVALLLESAVLIARAAAARPLFKCGQPGDQ